MTPGHNMTPHVKVLPRRHYFTHWDVLILHNNETEVHNITIPSHNITMGGHSALGGKKILHRHSKQLTLILDKKGEKTQSTVSGLCMSVCLSSLSEHQNTR